MDKLFELKEKKNMQQAITDTDMEELMKLPEVMSYLRISRPTAMRWLKDGKLPGHKVGSTYRFYRSELKKMITPVDVVKPEQGEEA